MEEIIERLERIEKQLAQQKEVLNAQEVAELLGTNRMYVYQLTHKHVIPFYRPNDGRIYFKRSEIEEWMLSNRQATDEELAAQAETYVATKKLR